MTIRPRQGTTAENTHRRPTSGAATVVAMVLLLLVAIVPFTWLSGLGVLAAWETILRRTVPLLVVIVPLAAAGAGGVLHRLRLTVLGVALAVVGVAYLVGVHSYLVDHQYARDVVTIEETTSYAERAPWTVANAFAQRDQGDVVGEREDVHFVPQAADAAAADGDGTSRYTTLIRARGPLGLAGYEAVQTMSMPTAGAIPGGVSTYCEMPENMDDKLGTIWPWHSLSWAIHAKAPLAHWSSDDAYGYCQDGNPVVVVPLWEYDGWWTVTRSPAGAAVYTPDGVDILDAGELSDAGIAGPTYPRALAETQRSAINAGGSLADYWGKRYGYETTDKDDDDANAGNTTELTMIAADGTQEYVTPLTPRGSSQSMTAIASIPSTQDKPGRAPVTVNTSPAMQSTSTITTSIKESSVHGDSAWTTRWASGMTVYEVLPGRDGHWVASIGQGQAVSYRADIASDGSVTVTNADTGQTSADSPTDDTALAPDGKPLGQMSDAELLDRIDKATQELKKRQEANG